MFAGFSDSGNLLPTSRSKGKRSTSRRARRRRRQLCSEWQRMETSQERMRNVLRNPLTQGAKQLIQKALCMALNVLSIRRTLLFRAMPSGEWPPQPGGRIHRTAALLALVVKCAGNSAAVSSRASHLFRA